MEKHDADIVCKQADKLISKLKKPKIFTMFIDKDDILEEIRKKLIYSCGLYKKNKLWESSAKCYFKLAAIQESMGSFFEACESYKNSGDMFKKCGEVNFALYTSAIDGYKLAYACAIKEYNFIKAGKIAKEIGYLYDNVLVLHDQALIFYQQAIDCMDAENNNTHDIEEQIAIIYIKQKNFFAGGLAFHNIVKKLISNNKFTYLIPRYILKECLCLIASNNTLEARDLLVTYSEYSYFKSSYECNYLSDLIEIVQNKDEANFETSMMSLNAIGRIDDLNVAMFKQIKQNIQTDIIEL